MNRKVTNLIIVIIVLAVLIGVGVGVYFYRNQGPVIGRIQYGVSYHLTSIRPTERFAGAEMDAASYFRIETDGKNGSLYLKGLTATTAPIPFVVTNYQEGSQQTIIEFEYLLDQGEDTRIQHLTAISTDKEICIKAIELHDVRIIQQKHNEIDSLKYAVTILVFRAEQGAI